jgi:hypothetical protein
MISPTMAMYDFFQSVSRKNPKSLHKNVRLGWKYCKVHFDNIGALFTRIHFLSNLRMGATS